MNEKSLTKNHHAKADRTLLVGVYILFVYSLALATLHNTWLVSIVVGGGTAVLASLFVKFNPGKRLTRIFMGLSLMVMTILHVHQAHGMIEMHFGFFAFLALLLYYHDWLPIVTSAGLVAVYHIGFYYLQQQGGEIYVLQSGDRGWAIIVLHAGYLIAETIALIFIARDLFNKEVGALDLQQTVSKVTAQGSINLSHRCQQSSDVSQNFNGFIEHIHSLIKSMSSNGNSLATSSNDLINLIETNNQQLTAQQLETQKIASAVSEMTGAIQSIAQNAEGAASAANEAQQSVITSSEVSQRTQQSMHMLGGQINEASQAISTLASESNNIGSVLDVIRGIAEQTNLLALNAAIEAARAGEQGRGFAVVADEVRSLASRTQQSTEEINTMIKQLQEGSKSTVQAMEASQTLMKQCVKDTTSTNESLITVVDAMRIILDMNTLIASATTEQESVMQGVSQNTDALQNMSEGNAERLKGVLAASGSVKNVSQKMLQDIQLFKV